MFEFTENEEMSDTGHVENIVNSYREMGFTTAIDDFGAGHS
jgi:EAL domain-containing protein (putative c-di-GMP-specific phosphodiesterase class I)